jgi:signal transduction histidine kinase/ligand-binding sensor domain-containing protein
MAEGLSSSSVTAILQDRFGFIWIGTQGGLNKYDGRTFATYRYNPDDPHSLPDNFIYSLYEDRQGVLWMGTQDGYLVRYDRRQDQFNSFDVGVHALAMLEDAAGTFWVGTQEPGLLQVDRETEQVEVVWPGRVVHTMVVDQEGILWLGSPEAGVASWDPAGEQFVSVDYEGPVTQLYVDQEGTIWAAAGDGGIARYDPGRARFDFYPLDSGTEAAPNPPWATGITPCRAGGFWVGTANDGVFRVVTNSAGRAEPVQLAHYAHLPGDSHSLANDNIVFVYEDRAGVLWVGNSFNGLSKLPAGAGRFGHVRQVPDNPQGLQIDGVTALHADQGGLLWVGGFPGLDRWDRAQDEWTHYRHDPADPASLANDMVRSVYVDGANMVWVGTEGGLDRYDRTRDQFDHFDLPTVMWMLEDSRGTFWLATKGGLYQFDRRREEAVLVRPGWAWKIFLYEDRPGDIWVGTSGDGLERYSPQSGEWRTYTPDPGNVWSLSHHSVNAVGEDSDGTLWVASGDGLNRFDRASGTFSHFREADGLPDGWVSSLLVDSAGDLWLGTGNGLARFDPRAETFKTYFPSDGVQDAFFWRNAQYQSPAGELFLGGVNGFNAFRPETIVDNPQPPPVVVTAMQIDNETRRTDLVSGAQVLLDYQENFLSFDFAALDYNLPEKNQYAYMLAGLDADWVAAGTRTHADYPNLRPGSYVFRVKGANSDGVWNETGTAVNITIQPPFWATGWFRGLAVLVLVAAVYGGYRVRVRSLEARGRELEQQVQARTMELSAANTRLEQEMVERARAEEALAQERAEAAVLAERHRLARDLHDSVTQSLYSLTMFAEATRHQAAEQEAEQIAGQADQIGRVAQQALREMRLAVYELRPPELAQAGLARALRRRLAAVEGRAGITGRVVVNEWGPLPAEVEANLFRIAQEALNNTLKHAAAQTVTVTLDRRDAQVRLVVADDGCGFAPDERPGRGGLGLAGIRERVAEMGGTVSIDSRPGDGTCITVVVDLDEKHERSATIPGGQEQGTGRQDAGAPPMPEG